VEDGADLMSAAEDYAAQYAADTEHRYTGRMWVNLLMLLGALCGCIGIPVAFEKIKNRGMLIIPVLLSLACAVAAEIQCLQLGRGNSYSALAVAIFAGIQLLLVLPKPSAKT
jgi:hypothetical protein